jgi:hypothetical protein
MDVAIAAWLAMDHLMTAEERVIARGSQPWRIIFRHVRFNGSANQRKQSMVIAAIMLMVPPIRMVVVNRSNFCTRECGEILVGTRLIETCTSPFSFLMRPSSAETWVFLRSLVEADSLEDIYET